MKNYKSHDEVKQNFVSFMESGINTINRLDADVTYTPSEPQFWLDMMELKKSMIKMIAKHQTKYPL